MSFLKKIFQPNQDAESNDGTIPPSFFYFYFPNDKKKNAEKLATILKEDGFSTEIHMLDKDVNPNQEWTLKATKAISFDEIKVIYNIDERFTELAEEYGGDFDGHEVPTP